jgi:hypothetical protein
VFDRIKALALIHGTECYQAILARVVIIRPNNKNLMLVAVNLAKIF